jgi:hypothetical protein
VATPATRLKTLVAQSVIRQLQHEAKLERIAIDDSSPKVAPPLDSAQSSCSARQGAINA